MCMLEENAQRMLRKEEIIYLNKEFCGCYCCYSHVVILTN